MRKRKLNLTKGIFFRPSKKIEAMLEQGAKKFNVPLSTYLRLWIQEQVEKEEARRAS